MAAFDNAAFSASAFSASAFDLGALTSLTAAALLMARVRRHRRSAMTTLTPIKG